MSFSSDETGLDAFDLLCSEDAGAFDADSPDVSAIVCFEFPEDSDESIAGFIEGESDYSPGFDYTTRLRSRSLDPAARAECVAWIFKVQTHYCFRVVTAYLAVNYMDRFLSIHRLPSEEDEWPLQLLAVTCLSLAAKMEETLVPSFLDLQVEGTRFIFESRTIQRMELLVLNALNWRLRSVTPFTFIDFFAYKIDPAGKHMKHLTSRATQIIMAAIHDVDFLDHCQSSMAAGAIICAAGEPPCSTLVDPGTAVGWCLGLTEEGIRSCYRLMQQVALSTGRRKQPMVLSHIRVTTPVMMGSEIPRCCSTPPSKRRKVDKDDPQR